MLSVFKKVGGYEKAHEVLKAYGWDGEKQSLFIQSYRGSTSAKVALILWEYCLNKHIPVSREDFYKTTQN